MTWQPEPQQDQQKDVPQQLDEYGGAQPADDDSKWQITAAPGSLGPDAQLARCEDRLRRALKNERPQAILSAIFQNGCTALRKDTNECIKCRICPSGGKLDHVGAYYRGSKQRIYLCAEKEPSEEQVERLVTHELVHAYDHCRFSMRVPFVGRQAPWALTCGAEACSEVRAYLLSNAWKPSSFSSNSVSSSYDFGLNSGGEQLSQEDRYAPSSMFASDSTPADAAVAHREPVYHSALASTSAYGTCANGDARRVVDAVFNACLADYAPFTAAGNRAPNDGFPAMPPEVAAADAGKTV